MSHWAKANELEKQNISFVVVTLVNVRGSAPQDEGAKAIVSRNGLEAGTVGGGKVEAQAIDTALEILQSEDPKTPFLITWNLQKDIGMTCGGEVQFLFEHHHQQSWPICILGAGHVSQALCRTLANLNCQITCIDPRDEWLEKLPNKVKAIQADYPENLIVTLPKNSFFISMTKGHAFDVPVLKEIANHAPDAPYVGVIGSSVKANTIRSELKELGVDEGFIESIRSPIGLPIGTNNPFEIAISITAELLQVRDRLIGLPR